MRAWWWYRNSFGLLVTREHTADFNCEIRVDCCAEAALCQIHRDDTGEHDPIERPGAADAGDAGADLFDVTQVEQIRTDEWAEHARDEGDGASLGQGEEDSDRNHRGQDVSLKCLAKSPWVCLILH